MGQKQLIPLAVVLGPTGSGKSDLAIRIARERGGEIVNCDSLQIYRGFDIGTAKVPAAERQEIPHHLLDIAEPDQLFTAGDYVLAARRVLREIADRGALAVVVGGTGFYLRALLLGLSPGPPRSQELRAQLEQRETMRQGSLYRILKRLDPGAAKRIHSNDTQKTIRALELRLLERRPVADVYAQGRDPLRGFLPVKLGLDPPRRELYERLDARVVGMFDQGLVEEVRGLLDRGVPREAKPFESLGYKQALQLLDGRLTREQAIESTQIETRHYAKRQMTWFRKEPGVQWFPAFGNAVPVHSIPDFSGEEMQPLPSK